MLAAVSNCLVAMLYGGNLLADRSNVYVGLDILKTNYATQDRYGSNVFAKAPIAFNAFVGYKLPRNFFVEAGYERTKSKNRTARIGEGDYYPGGTIPYDPGRYEIYKTKLKLEYPYLGFGFNCYPFQNFTNTYFSALFGFSVTKANGELNYIDDDLPGLPAPAIIAAEYRTFKKNKIMPMFKVGINHNFSEKFGVRFTGTWHKLTTFKIKSAEGPIFAQLRFKNGYAFGLGLFYSI